jgi:hypothetical protein
VSSYRKKPVDIEVSAEAPPVLPPPAVAEPLTESDKPAEPPPLETSNSMEKAAKEATQSALRDRLREMENAESVQRANHQQRLATEPPQQPSPEEIFEQAIANLPERVQSWYRRDPQLFFNPKRAAQIQYTHHVVADEVGEGTDEYLARMEAMLFRRETNGSGNGHRPVQSAPTQEQRQSATPQRQAAPVQRQTYSGMPPAAPPSRDVPSASTGRPMSESMVRLTPEEKAFVREYAGAIPLTEEDFLQKKRQMMKWKVDGTIPE